MRGTWWSWGRASCIAAFLCWGNVAAAGPVAPSLVIHTSQGDVIIDLFPDSAPENVGHVLSLVRGGYFRAGVDVEVQAKFRVVFTRSGDEGQEKLPYRLKDEVRESRTLDRAGMVALLADAPDDNGSRLYINLVPVPHLSKAHTIIGQVRSGLSVLKGATPGPRVKTGPLLVTGMETIPATGSQPAFQKIIPWNHQEVAEHAAPLVKRLMESMGRSEGWGKMGAQQLHEFSQRGRQYQFQMQVEFAGRDPVQLVVLADRDGDSLHWRHLQVRQSPNK